MKKVVDTGFDMQYKSKQAVERIQSKLVDTENIAIASALELKRQNEKLMVLDEKLNKIEGVNKRTDKYLRSLGRGLVADKLHLFMAICICANLILLIVLVATGWKQFFPTA